MRKTEDDLVWYVSYGSNTDRERFLCYIMGGNLPGNSRDYTPCKDISEPADSRPIKLNRQLWFGGESLAWGGGVANLGHPVVNDTVTLGRAYLIKPVQLEHVVQQETQTSGFRLKLSELIKNEHLEIKNALYYDRVVYLGEPENRPMATLVTTQSPEHKAPRKPYLARVAFGLHQTGFDREVVADYLAATPGIQGAYTRSEILALINEVIDPTADSQSALSQFIVE